MRIDEVLVRNVSYPLWMWRDGRFSVIRYLRQYLAELDAPDGSRRQADRRLLHMLNHAVENVPYYRELGVSKSRSVDELASNLGRFPLLTKEIVKEQADELLSTTIDRDALMPSGTGGSTGTPMKFWRTNECIAQRKAQEAAFDAMMGYRWGKRMALFVSAAHTHGMLSGLKQAIRNSTCERMLRFDPNNANEEYLSGFQRRFERARPRYIRCFPNSLVLFAEFLAARGQSYDFVAAISVTGENLYTWQRELFESVFGARVFERYATKECGVIAGQSIDAEAMRIFTPGVHVEVIDRNGRPCEQNEVGRIVVTDLFNEAMPLIRYDVGDLGSVSVETGPDGRTVPVMTKLLGRDRDIVLDSEGVPRPGYLFVELVSKLDTGMQFQFVQESRSLLIVNVVTGDGPSSEIERVRRETQQIVGPKVEVRVREVEKIERDGSGKYSYVISKLDRADRHASLGR